MSFVSIAFLLLYPVALVLRIGFAREARGAGYFAGLLLLSLVFYGWHVPSYLVLILASTLADYTAGRWLARLPRERGRFRGAVLAGSVLLNLGLLGVFKYAGFFAELVHEVRSVFGTTGGDFTPIEIALPIGISFYTFQSMSYTIDVYREKISPERNFVRFALFVAFFPQLVAGPIIRAGDFMQQMVRRRRLSARVLLEGGYLLIRGLFLKLVVADNLGKIVDTHWTAAAQGDASGFLAISMVIFFSCQLLCDFAGYSDIARGLAYPLGFRLPVNFNAPFLAATFSEFWRRWHITLSQWMRDYVYISLGGNQRGFVRVLVNLFIVMVVSGLWHGASGTFVIWGAVHGVAIVIERASRGVRSSVIASGLWFVVVQVTWILSLSIFRSRDVAEAWRIASNALSVVFEPTSQSTLIEATTNADLVTAWLFTLPVWLMHIRAGLAERGVQLGPVPLERAVCAGVMLVMVATFYAKPDGFIYFQF